MAKAAVKIKPAPKARIESITTTGRGVEVTFIGVRLIYDGISEVIESVFEGQKSYNFKAGLEIPDNAETQGLIKTIRQHFAKLQIDGFHNKAALDHFDRKKFQPNRDGGALLLYPTSPAVETDVGFQPKGRLFVNPSHDAFYAGCYVEAKVSFVANMRGAVTIKDYLNGIRFVQDGERISGVTDPWENSEAKGTVRGVRSAPEPEEREKPKKTFH